MCWCESKYIKYQSIQSETPRMSRIYDFKGKCIILMKKTVYDYMGVLNIQDDWIERVS